MVPVVFEGTDAAWPKGAYLLRPRTPMRVLALDPLEAKDFSSASALCTEVQARIDRALLGALA